MDEIQEGYAQGTWEHVKPEPEKIAGRKDGRGPRHFIDTEAFGRLVKKYGRPDGTIDARPMDVRDVETAE